MIHLQPTTLLVALLLVPPAAAFGQLRGSGHDFSKSTWSRGESCLPCHNAHCPQQGAGEAAPLWNRSPATAFYRVYTSPTFRAESGQPAGVSRLCLSCHDGITPLDAFGGAPGTTSLAGAGVIGPAPGEHHPVSFVFDSALAAATGDLRDPATSPSGQGGTIATDLLTDGRVECTSCHDVHNTGNNLRYLEVGGGPDRLCEVCHIGGR